jgi:hypothetical protein
MIYHRGIDRYTKLLISGRSSYIQDYATLKAVMNTNSVTLSSTQRKLNCRSLYFNKNSNQYLSLANSDDWNFGNGNFTIDFWMYNLTNTDFQGIITKYKDSNNRWTIQFRHTDGIMDIYAISGGVTLFNTYPSFGANLQNMWNHWAFIRNGNNLYIALNGILNSPIDVTGVTMPNIAENINLGRLLDGTNYLNAYMDEIRISKGIARWTKNFIPPTRPYQNDLYINKSIVYLPGTAWTLNVNDTLSISDDKSSSYKKNLADTLSLGDAISKTPKPVISDTLSLSDSISKTAKPVISDSIILSDNISKIVAFVRTISDTLNLSDSQKSELHKNLSDVLNLSDSFSRQVEFNRTVDDILNLNDSITKSAGKNIDDALTLSDSITIIRAILLLISDTLSLSDNVSKVTGKNITDTITFSDLISKGLQIHVIDTLTLTDSFSKAMRFVKNVSDNITFSDDQLKSLHKAIVDILTISDSVSKTVAYYRIFNDTVQLTDSQSKAIHKLIADTLTIQDSIDTVLTIVNRWIPRITMIT